jgi:serine/threonine protein kinase
VEILQYRSPEEFANRPLDEKIDVWSFGNNIYGLLTGLWVFYQNDDDGVVHVSYGCWCVCSLRCVSVHCTNCDSGTFSL